MTSRSSGPGRHPAAMALCLMLACAAVAVVFTATAHAGYYKMVACSGNSGAPPYTFHTNTTSPQNPAGIFAVHNWCGGAGGDPPGEAAYMRIEETQPAGNAGNGAYGGVYFDTPGYVHFKSAGGYTRQLNQFNDGWRARFWVASASGTAQLMTQGAGLPNSGGQWLPTSTFGPHLWPVGGLWDFTRFVYEMNCVRPAGCDRSGANVTDLNGLVFILSDDSPSQVAFNDAGNPFTQGSWVRGGQVVNFQLSDLGSGIRRERMLIDGAQVWNWEHIGDCATSTSQVNGEWARTYVPCPIGGPWPRGVAVNTATVSDGAHTVQLCTQDYGQFQGLYGTGGETCAHRIVHTDNTAPGGPAGLFVTSSNPARYIDHFGAIFSLPPNQGSPIAKVHYAILNAAGNVVQGERVVSATNPIKLAEITGPKAPGAYQLKLWLEDAVGLVGPAVTAPIPHDSTPPAAPQGLRVEAASTERRVEHFGLRWQDPTDAGSPIDTAHFQVLDSAGNVVRSTQTVKGDGVRAIDAIKTPAAPNDYKVRVWLEDQEGNVGAASTVAVPRDKTPPASPQAVAVTPPQISRAADGFDVTWRNLIDAGSAIDTAHYEVRDGNGNMVVPATSVRGPNVERIADLNTPRGSGPHVLRLWLSDAEGNVGAPVAVPLAYSCVRSDTSAGRSLTSAAGRRGRTKIVLKHGKGARLRGRLLGEDRVGVAGASVCVFTRVATDAERRFAGIAITDAKGRYRFAIPSGPSRELIAAYRSGHREVSTSAEVVTRVRPTFKVRRKIVPNNGVARFFGRIPGPHNDRVVVVLQVKSGKGWRVFRRYRTRANGRYVMRYRFTRTTTPTTYVMRAQVRRQGGYPYEQGNSKRIRLTVLP